MFKFLLGLVLISSFITNIPSSSAAKYMSKAEQKEYINDIAKKIRHQYWRQGADEVNSYSKKSVTKKFLNEYVKAENNKWYETPLSRDQIANLYKCYHVKFCKVYLVSIGIDQMGGSAGLNHFILLNIKNRKHKEISHMIMTD